MLDARDASENREEFIREMGERGWTVSWEEKRKHITFEDREGHKVRDSNLSKTFMHFLSQVPSPKCPLPSVRIQINYSALRNACTVITA